MLIARLLRARHMDQCNGRLNTASSHRDTLAPHKVQECKLPSTLALDNLDASLSVRFLLISRRSMASALKRATRVCRRLALSAGSCLFEEQAHGLLRGLAAPDKGPQLVHRLTWREIESSLAGNDLVSSRPSGLPIIFCGSRL